MKWWGIGSLITVALLLGLVPLLGTHKELLAVAKSLGVPESEIRLGAEATETAVMTTAMSDYRIVWRRDIIL